MSRYNSPANQNGRWNTDLIDSSGTSRGHVNNRSLFLRGWIDDGFSASLRRRRSALLCMHLVWCCELKQRFPAPL
jgi:hypothetical protein